jgi:hypothetical protein
MERSRSAVLSLPAPLRTLHVLRLLNIAAVGLSLAAIVSAVSGGDDGLGIYTGLSSLFVGTLWARLFRSRRLIWKRWRIGWVACIPLASLNAGLSLGLAMAADTHVDRGRHFLVGATAGATIGAIIWVPALVATIVVFGLPIARAQALAALGLAGEERGERIVGTVCAAVSAVALGIAATMASHFGGVWSAATFGGIGGIAGATAAILAWRREVRRRDFVSGVEAGQIAGYRIAALPEGKVLFRIVSQGQSYRVADFEEPIAELGAEDEVTRLRA